VETGIYDRMFVIRHNVSVGEKNGFLKGTKEEKIEGWLGFLKDNMDFTQMTFRDMLDRGFIEVDAVEYMKGRDIKNAWVMIDEAEDLTEDQFKMLGERISDKSNVCFIGDMYQVTNTIYKQSSGLCRAIDNLKNNPSVGIIVFDDVEKDNVRSQVSRIFTSQY
jgi:predicted ribonuclease YlaK